jgi:hypothetical protein
VAHTPNSQAHRVVGDRSSKAIQAWHRITTCHVRCNLSLLQTRRCSHLRTKKQELLEAFPWDRLRCKGSSAKHMIFIFLYHLENRSKSHMLFPAHASQYFFARPQMMVLASEELTGSRSIRAHFLGNHITYNLSRCQLVRAFSRPPNTITNMGFYYVPLLILN